MPARTGGRAKTPAGSRLHLAVIGPSRHPLIEPYVGGQESLTANLVSRLRRRGHRVRLYAAPGTSAHLADELVTFEQLPGLSATAERDAQLPEPDYLREHHAYTGVVADLMASAQSRPDVIVNQSLHHLPLSMSRALPAPVVTTLHTPPIPWMEVGVALADERARYVAVSAFQARSWTTLPPTVQVIPNGVDREIFRPGGGGPDLLWVGRITPEKGTRVAIEAARSAGRRLTIVGPVCDRAYFAGQVAPALGGSITYAGHLGQTEIAALLGRSAALLVTPQWDEPFGLVAAEALMCATPVIGIARGAVPEVVGRAGALIPPGASSDVVAGLARAIRTVDDVNRGAVREWAQRRLCLDKAVDRYEALLQALTR